MCWWFVWGCVGGNDWWFLSWECWWCRIRICDSVCVLYELISWWYGLLRLGWDSVVGWWCGWICFGWLYRKCIFVWFVWWFMFGCVCGWCDCGLIVLVVCWCLIVFVLIIWFFCYEVDWLVCLILFYCDEVGVWSYERCFFGLL